MRSITVLAVTVALSGLLVGPSGAAESADSARNPQTSLKRVYEPDPNMIRAPDAGSLTPGTDVGNLTPGTTAGSLTPGAEKRGLQAVGPARATADQGPPPHFRDRQGAAR